MLAQLRIATWAAGAPSAAALGRSTCDEGRRRSAPGSAASPPRCACRALGARSPCVEQRAAPGRARLPAARRRLHVGHRPVADHDAVGAGGDVRRRRARPALRGRRCAGSTRSTGSAGRARTSTSTSPTTRRGCATRSRKFSPRDAARVDAFLAALRADLRATGILAAGRRPFLSAGRLRAARARAWSGSRAARRCTLRRAPLRAPARARGVLVPLAVHRRRPASACRRSTARSSTCRCSTAAGTPTAASTRSSRRWRGRSTCAAASRSSAIEHAGGRVTGVRLAGGERIAADVGRLQRRRAAHARAARPPPAAPPAAPDDVLLPALPRHRPARSSALLHHTLLVGDGLPRVHPRRHARARAAARRSRPTSTRPSRTEPAMAAPGGDSLARPAAGARTCARGIDWDREGDRLRDALVADLEATFGLSGLDASVRVEHRMTPVDFAARARRRVGQRVRGRADAAPVGLLPPRRTATGASPGCTTSAAGRTPARASPACCSAPRSRPGWWPPTAARRRARGGRRGVSTAPERTRPLARARRARHATAWRGRSRSPAGCCRAALPRRRLPALPRLPHARRPRRRGPPRRRPSASRRSRRGRAARTAPRDARGRGARRARRAATRCRATRSPTSARACATTSTGAPFATEADARPLLLPRRRHRRRRDGRACSGRATPRARAAGRRGARDGDAAHEHPARHRRGRAPPAASTSRARRSLRFGAPAPGRARGAAARPDRAAPTRSTTQGLAGRPVAAPRPPRGRRRGVDVPRDPAPDRARRLRRAAPAARSSPRRRKLVGRRARGARALIAARCRVTRVRPRG